MTIPNSHSRGGELILLASVNTHIPLNLYVKNTKKLNIKCPLL